MTVAGGHWSSFMTSRVLTFATPIPYLVTFGLFLFANGDKDWDQMLAFQRVALWGLALSGGSKEWNPVMAGGMSLAGEPQMGVLSLSMLLSHVIAPVAALKLAALFFLGLGWAGTHLLAQRWGFGKRTSALAASLFVGNGYILARLATGHLKFDTAMCLPLWLLGSSESLRRPGEAGLEALRRLLLLGLSFGVLFVLSCDGAPFSILLVVVWVGLDAALLAVQRRTLRPVAFLAVALASGALLDAVYVFPMVKNSFYFPRLEAAGLVNPLVFFIFLLLPTLGHPFPPVHGMGHEFSVYIGPVLACLLIRYGRRALAAVPRADRQRLFAVSAAVLVLGLGSAPFALLAWLPGFRTVAFPARFWGFLSLPFALFGAVAIREFEAEKVSPAIRWAVSSALVVSLVGFEAWALPPPFLSRLGRVPVPEVTLPAKIERIENVQEPLGSQAATILPTRGLIHAYADYVRGEIEPGAELVRGGGPVVARWDGWNDIELAVPESAAPTHVELNQNFHPFWSSSAGTVSKTKAGNLALDLPAVTESTSVHLSFRDPYSVLGQRVTSWSAAVTAVIVLVLASVGRIPKIFPT